MGAWQRIKRFIVSLLIIGFIGGSIFAVLKYTDLISFHCTVTFDGNGYELEEDEVFVKKNETVDLPELNREGYTFHGWYLGDVKWTEDKKITSNITLLAKWSPLQYDITFFVGDDTFIQKVNYDTIPTFDGTPTKENADKSKEFKFIGWEPALTVVKGNAFYTAKFQEVVKTFDINVTMIPANAGIVTGAGEYEYGTVANIGITPNNGYEFLGWFNTDDTLHSTNNALSFPNIKNDVNLIAKFDVINKNIYYKDIPQECSNSNPDTYNITNGIIKLAGLEKSGYTFRGWFTESEGNGEKISTIDSSTLVDYTLYAYFTPTQYTINYYLNGGSLALNAPRLYTIESDNFALVSPTKDRFIFIGWTSPDHPEPTKDITIEQGSCGNKEFTAHWTIATYTITFDVNGTTYNQEVEDGQIPMFNGDTTIPDTPYAKVTFNGWQPSIVPAKENAIYKALYSYDYKKYTVQLATNIYNAGILTGTGSYNWGTDVNITATENTGFKFIGWYQNGQLISEDQTYKIEKIAKSVSIEGRFEMLTSMITYNDVPDGIINNNPTSYDIFDGIITLKNLDIAGYTFEGWFDERNGKGNKITEINCLTFTDYTLYAHIIIKNYTITYDLDGGEVYITNPTSYNINTDTFTINNPIKEHYTFLGWTTLENNTPNTTITVTKGSLGDKVFKAKWKANLYDITFIVDGVSEIKKFEYNTMPDYGKTPIKAPDDGGLTTYSFTGWLPQLALVSGNATYTAQFDSNIETFTLTLNASPTSGGSIQGGGTYAYNANIQISAIPNTGYTFVGWYKDNTIYNSNANTTINGLTANTTLTAKFDIITATISYENTKGASNPNPTSYNINTSNIPLKDISVNGYTFNGWYTGENGSGSKITTINTSSLENYRLYANLEVIPYTITYYLNGGDPLSNPTTYNVETPTFTLNNPTKTGYTFAGWKLSNTGNPIKNITITQGSTGDKEYTAYYTINKYTVTFKGYDMNIEITDKYEYNDKANKYYTSDIASSLENKIIDGANCTFLGWALQENSSSYIDLNNYPITNNTTFFAIFDITRNSYYVTIDTNKSSAIGSLSYTIDGITNEITSTTSNSITIEHGKSITLNITISNTKGYTFNGWKKDGSLIANNNTNSYTIQNVQSSTTLISQFSCKTYNITYDTQALKGAYNPNTRTTYTIEDSNIILQDPTLTGYSFKGWFTGGNGSGTKMTQITTSTLDNYTLYAHWEANTYSIKFENSKGVVPNEILYKITDNIISLPTLSLDGYNFDGWYEDSAKYTNINPTTAKDYTLEAHWALKSYTITYDLDGGTVSGNPTTYTIESNTFTLINPTKTDFKFTGWTGTNLNSKTTTVTIEQGSTGNKIYTAHWTPNQSEMSTITFEVDGTELINDSITALSGSNITAPSVDSAEYGMTGYNIDGWYIDEECTTKYTFSTMPSSDITLYGEWDYFIYQGFFPYLEEFQSATTNNITYIDSYEELVAWLDYILFYNITTEYELQITYKDFLTSDEFRNELAQVSNEYIFPGNGKWTYRWQTQNNKCSMFMNTIYSDTECTKVADSGKNYIYEQQEYAFAREYIQVRNNNNTNFKINKVADTLEVSTSNQLMYALEIGIKPICKNGSTAKNVYDQAKRVLNQICDDSMSDMEKIEAIYEWLILNVQYDNYAFNNYQDTWWQYDAWFAEGVFNNGVAVCDGIAKAFSILAKIENIPVARVRGNNHAWNKVYIDGNWYGVDATHGDIGITDLDVSFLTYSQFFFTDTQKTGYGYSSDIRNDIICDTTFNYYDTITYNYNGQGFDLVVNSQEELTLILLYIKDTYDTSNSNFLTLEFILGYELSSSNLLTLINTSLINAGYGFTYSGPPTITLSYINSSNNVNLLYIQVT